jgi:hypothetical protein
MVEINERRAIARERRKGDESAGVVVVAWSGFRATRSLREGEDRNVRWCGQ